MPEDGDQYVGLCVVYAKKLLLYEADLYNSQWNTQGFYFQPYPWENKNSLVSMSGQSQGICLKLPSDGFSLGMA